MCVLLQDLEGGGSLMVVHLELEGQTYLMHHCQESKVGEYYLWDWRFLAIVVSVTSPLILIYIAYIHND